jgi:hypothetical protein
MGIWEGGVSDLRYFSDLMNEAIEFDRVRVRAVERHNLLKKFENDWLDALRHGVDKFPSGLAQAREGLLTICHIMGWKGANIIAKFK